MIEFNELISTFIQQIFGWIVIDCSVEIVQLERCNWLAFFSVGFGTIFELISVDVCHCSTIDIFDEVREENQKYQSIKICRLLAVQIGTNEKGVPQNSYGNVMKNTHFRSKIRSNWSSVSVKNLRRRLDWVFDGAHFSVTL